MATTTSANPTSRGRGALDQLALEGLLLAVAAISLIVGFAAVLGALGGDSISATVSFKDDAPHLIERSGQARLDVANPTLTIEDPGTAGRILGAAPTLLGVATVGATAILLWRVVRSTRQGDPFHRANARRLTAAAVVVLVGGSASSLIDAVHSMDLASQAPEQFGLAVAGTFSFLPLAVGGVLAAMAGVFRRGTALRTEVEGLI